VLFLLSEQKSEIGISDGLIRISVGLENKEDILKDILSVLR
jgi:cystathionine beta-lyase/cystathionine gamma-synthase